MIRPRNRWRSQLHQSLSVWYHAGLQAPKWVAQSSYGVAALRCIECGFKILVSFDIISFSTLQEHLKVSQHFMSGLSYYEDFEHLIHTLSVIANSHYHLIGTLYSIFNFFDRLLRWTNIQLMSNTNISVHCFFIHFRRDTATWQGHGEIPRSTAEHLSS